MILKLHGVAPERTWESFVVTDDYIEYLPQNEVATALPVGLGRAPAAEPLPFLGYGVHEWNLRLVPNRLWADAPVNYRSWAVAPAARPVERAFWRSRDVDLLEAGSRSTSTRSPGMRASGRSGALMEARFVSLARPYKGLAAFDDSDLDVRFFFGRERETEVIGANVMASRLTVLYGPLGVGKSSVLRAGVSRRLRSLADAIVAVFNSWSGDSAAGLQRAVAHALGVEQPPPDVTPPTAVALAAGSGGDLYLLLDQFEEVFVYPRRGPRSVAGGGREGNRASG